MTLKIANAPTSWGIEDPTDRTNPPWRRVLDEAATAGYRGIELGPLGYLPDDGAALRAELDERSLQLVAGYLFEPLETPSDADRASGIAERTCELLAAAGARHLVVIQGFTVDRERAAGRPGTAAALTDDEWENLVTTIHRIARIAVGHGLDPCFHPHAGTHVEYEAEIERLAAATDKDLVGLCIDTGHCAYVGVDPVALYRRHADRVRYFHLKDVDPAALEDALARGLSFNEAVVAGVFCPLGAGVVDFAALRVALAEHGYDGWATVEQDRLPSDTTTPAEDAAASLEHLLSVGLG
jgi:inosose dehydratase